jgi:hypothetical protein
MIGLKHNMNLAADYDQYGRFFLRRKVCMENTFKLGCMSSRNVRFMKVDRSALYCYTWQ